MRSLLLYQFKRIEGITQTASPRKGRPKPAPFESLACRHHFLVSAFDTVIQMCYAPVTSVTLQ